MRSAALALSLAALCAAVALGQPPAAGDAAPSDSPANREQIDAALKLTTEAAGKYELMLAGHDSAAKLIKEPVLRWSNPAVGEIHGNVFLWTVDTRPVAVGSLFK